MSEDRIKRVRWYNGQNVDQEDMTDESYYQRTHVEDYINDIHKGIIVTDSSDNPLTALLTTDENADSIQYCQIAGGSIYSGTPGINNVNYILAQKFKARADNVQGVRVYLGKTVDIGDNEVWCEIRGLADPNDPASDPLPAAIGTGVPIDNADIQLAGGWVYFDFRGVVNLSMPYSLVPGAYYALCLYRTAVTGGNVEVYYQNDNLYSFGNVDWYNGAVWTDYSADDLDFQILTNAVQVSEGIGFATGKRINNTVTQVISLVETSGTNYNYITAHVIEQDVDIEAKPKTTDLEYSRVQDVVEFKVFTEVDWNNPVIVTQKDYLLLAKSKGFKAEDDPLGGTLDVSMRQIMPLLRNLSVFYGGVTLGSTINDEIIINGIIYADSNIVNVGSSASPTSLLVNGIIYAVGNTYALIASASHATAGVGIKTSGSSIGLLASANSYGVMVLQVNGKRGFYFSGSADYGAYVSNLKTWGHGGAFYASTIGVIGSGNFFGGVFYGSTGVSIHVVPNTGTGVDILMEGAGTGVSSSVIGAGTGLKTTVDGAGGIGAYISAPSGIGAKIIGNTVGASIFGGMGIAVSGSSYGISASITAHSAYGVVLRTTADTGFGYGLYSLLTAFTPCGAYFSTSALTAGDLAIGIHNNVFGGDVAGAEGLRQSVVALRESAYGIYQSVSTGLSASDSGCAYGIYTKVLGGYLGAYGVYASVSANTSGVPVIGFYATVKGNSLGVGTDIYGASLTASGGVGTSVFGIYARGDGPVATWSPMGGRFTGIKYGVYGSIDESRVSADSVPRGAGGYFVGPDCSNSAQYTTMGSPLKVRFGNNITGIVYALVHDGFGQPSWVAMNASDE